MEAIFRSETSVHIRTTPRYVPEDGDIQTVRSSVLWRLVSRGERSCPDHKQLTGSAVPFDLLVARLHVLQSAAAPPPPPLHIPLRLCDSSVQLPLLCKAKAGIRDHVSRQIISLFFLFIEILGNPELYYN
jgi:hypothetical protein